MRGGEWKNEREQLIFLVGMHVPEGGKRAEAALKHRAAAVRRS